MASAPPLVHAELVTNTNDGGTRLLTDDPMPSLTDGRPMPSMTRNPGHHAHGPPMFHCPMGDETMTDIGNLPPRPPVGTPPNTKRSRTEADA